VTPCRGWHPRCNMLTCFRSKETPDCGPQRNTRRFQWVRSLTNTVWVCPDTAVTPATPLPHHLTQEHGPTGCGSALRIKTTIYIPSQIAAQSRDGGWECAHDPFLLTTPTPSGMHSPLAFSWTSRTPAWWWNWTNARLPLIEGVYRTGLTMQWDH